MSLDWTKKPCVYTVPAGVSFVETLAAGIMDMAGDDPLSLAGFQILLPTRRACRSLRDAFLKITEGRPLLLPRLHPIGDVDEEELSLLLSGMDDDLSLPPSISPLRRQFLLTKLIGSMESHARGLEQDMVLAAALGRLMDQVYTEDLDLKNLPGIVDREKFAEHWQISLDFLSILSEHWPNILAEQGVIDSADRRNRLLKKLAAHWRDNPPNHKIIAAGSTGSIPATAALLNTIAQLPHGCIVLPGLDQRMDDASWKALDDTHPQATLRHLLGVLGINRSSVHPWPYSFGEHTPSEAMHILTSELMRPADTAQAWQDLKNTRPIGQSDLSFERYDCANPQEEALVIALAMREALQSERTTAALVTPDRRLARRVAMACRRWNIEVDDSAGEPLSQTPVGMYLRLCMEAVIEEVKPVSLLTFAKYGLCQPKSIDDWRIKIRSLDEYVMRGAFFEGGLETYFKKIDALKKRNRPVPDDAIPTLTSIGKLFAPLLDLIKKSPVAPFESWVEAHLQCAENFSDAGLLWVGQAGEAAALFLADLREQSILLPPVTASQYLAVLEQTMKNIPVRPAFGLHPRLMILGQLEARLVEADVMILSGLNEKTWPPDAGTDPWMSRPMRKRFGLPPMERGIGLSAHDFAQAFCARKTILTRSVRVDGTPTVPSRWLQRLDTVLQACGLSPDDIRRGDLLPYARAIDHTDVFTPYERPAPTPPVQVRPRKLSVTQVEKWMQDPYSIYAEHILKLKKLPPLEQKLDAAMRGTLIHDVMYRFVGTHMDDIPSHAYNSFVSITKEELESLSADDDIISLWQPRLSKIADWVIAQDRAWRINFKPAGREVKGEYIINSTEGDFTLTARADRIDFSPDGTRAAIIDYKSGGSYSITKMKNGQYPQLPLEALILENGKFEGLNNYPVTALSYWIVNGGGDGGKILSLQKPDDLTIAKDNARHGLQELVENFDVQATPYYSIPYPENAPRFNDYEHLARILEWTALDDQGEAA